MGFLDKAKAAVNDVAQKGQETLDGATTKKKADGLFRDLGVVTYAEAQGRQSEESQAEIGRILTDLRALEAAAGPLDTTVKSGQPDTPPPPFIRRRPAASGRRERGSAPARRWRTARSRRCRRASRTAGARGSASAGGYAAPAAARWGGPAAPAVGRLRPSRRRRAGALALVLGLVAIIGCRSGSGDGSTAAEPARDSSTTTESTTTTISPEEAARRALDGMTVQEQAAFVLLTDPPEVPPPLVPTPDPGTPPVPLELVQFGPDRQPVLGPDGTPRLFTVHLDHLGRFVTDDAGRPVITGAGSLVLGDDGRPILRTVDAMRRASSCASSSAT